MKPEELLKQQPKEYSTIHIDMNSFFASVEQFHDPKLRGQPVAVATTSGGGGSVVAASIEARQFGIRAGTKVAEARSKCPEIVVVRDSPNSYRAVHRQIMDILYNTACYVRPKSIDEAYLKVPSYMQTKKQVLALVKGIKAYLFECYNEHILCSVEIASNIWLAKMGSSSHKPNGLVVLTKSDHQGFYSALSLVDLTGINWRMARYLYAIGIDSPSTFYEASWRFLRSKLGVNGAKWYLRMRGIEVDFKPVKANKSISHQITTMPNPPSSFVELTTYINKIAPTLGDRLRKKSLVARGMTIHINYVNGAWWGNVFRNTVMYRSNYEIIKLAKMLLKKQKNFNEPVQRIIITLINLTSDHQLSLPTYYSKQQTLRLACAADRINDKFGKNTIMPLRSLNSDYSNLNRVGFAGDLLRERANPTDREHHM